MCSLERKITAAIYHGRFQKHMVSFQKHVFSGKKNNGCLYTLVDFKSTCYRFKYTCSLERKITAAYIPWSNSKAHVMIIIILHSKAAKFTWKMRNMLKWMKNKFFRFLVFYIWTFLYSFFIRFSTVGGGRHILSWEKSENWKKNIVSFSAQHIQNNKIYHKKTLEISYLMVYLFAL